MLCLKTRTFLIFAVYSIVSGAAAVAAGDTGVKGLRCDHLVDPLGVDRKVPRLSWRMIAANRGARQTAYRILVASSPKILAQDRGGLWDSGKVKSDRSHLVSYAGKALASHQQCFWKVRIWDGDGKPLAWSPVARWTMGVLAPEHWRARWIAASVKGPAVSLPIFRREFQVSKPLGRAVAYISGLGHYELYLDGGKVGDRILDPPWTNYRKTCLYATYDITEKLSKGSHALGIMLGNGMYNVKGGRYTKFKGTIGQPKLIMHLRLEYADGTVERVVSDKSWRVTEGPITFSCVYGGEDRDARREPTGWLKAGFDDAKWRPAAEVDGPGGAMRSTIQQPVKTTRVFKPVKMTGDDKGVTIDFGQNSAAIPAVRLKGLPGATVRIRTGERATAGGWNRTWFDYTLRGNGPEEFSPSFTSWGHRSILVEGAVLKADKAVDKPVVLDAKAFSIRCGAPLAGAFETSDKLINKIYHIVLWSIHSNFQSVLTDCPHREKLGWQEVSHLMGPAIHFIYDAAGFYTKILNDCAQAQTAEGLIPDIAPEYVKFRGGFRDSPEWGSAFIINPYFLYLWTGDNAPIARHYEAMKRYIAYLRGKSRGGILSHGLGDWMPGEKTPTPLVATAIFYHDLDLMAQYATWLEQPNDAKAFRAEADAVRKAFNARFLVDTTAKYANGSQCAQGMPSALGLVPPDQYEKALGLLVADGKAKKKLTAGDVGNRYAILSFAQAGAHELLYNISNATYGHQARQPDRTTLAEAWRGGASQNHCMLGHILEWYHGWLAGIRPDPDAPGFKKIIIDPNPVGDMAWCKAHHDSPYGRIAVHWRRQDDGFHLDVKIPPNTTATVHVPGNVVSDITEGEQTIDRARCVKLVRVEKGKTVFSVGSGNYKFLSRQSRKVSG